MIRRLFRLLLNGLTVLSLALLLAVTVVWVRSYWRPDHFAREPFDPERGTYRQDKVQSHDGRLCLQFACFYADDVLRRQAASRAQGAGRERWRHDAAVMFGVPDASGRERHWPYLLVWRHPLLSGFTAVIPYWTLGAAALPLPAIAAAAGAARRRRERRIGAGLCPACGYDIRASPGRCSECGTSAMTPA